ncbi:MAG TPA: pilus assembly protein TadG-related protein, partial [Thermoguttaceae bacterium]|nr:pilus assembly protein TadG-related protein [Thermoguttaceae bacterium]
MCDTASITVNLARHVRSPDCRSGDLHSNRKGAITFVMAFMLIGLVAILALALDIGYLAVARTELQRSADAAAMASAGTLLDERRLKGEADLQELHAESRDAAQRYSALNDVCRSGPIVQRNEANDPDGDIVFGRFDGGETLSSSGSANLYNAVHVR